MRIKSVWSAGILCGSALLLVGLVIGQEKLKPTSQQSNSERVDKPNDRTVEEQRQLLGHILDILRVTAEDANKWQDGAVAARIQAKISDVFWNFYPDVGRDYLIRAWTATERIEQEKQERSRFRNGSRRNDARRDVLLIARRRAPDLAKKWLELMTKETEDARDSQPRGAFDDRTARATVLLEMALRTVDNDPQAAASLATNSLQDGVSFGFQTVLLKLQEKDFELAQSVFRAALQRLQVGGLIDPSELLILYSYLYSPGLINSANTSDGQQSHQIAVGRDRPRIVPASQLNPSLGIEYLNLSADLLLAQPLPQLSADPQSSARTQLSVMSYLLSEMLKVLPEKAVALQTRIRQIDAEARFSTTSSSSASKTPVPQDGESVTDYAERRVDALEAAAEHEQTSLGRDIAYSNAAVATTVQHYERGLLLAGKVQDESLRNGIANWLIYRATLYQINSGDFEKAYRLNAQATESLQIAICLIWGAQKSIKEKDLIRARQWLEESRSFVKKAAADEDRSRVAFGIVSAYGQFDKTMAFESLASAVRLLHQTKSKIDEDERAPLIRRFSGLGTTPDFTYGTSGFNLKAAIKVFGPEVFGPEVFDDVLAVINNIPNPEVRGTGVVMLCDEQLRALHSRGDLPPSIKTLQKKQ